MKTGKDLQTHRSTAIIYHHIFIKFITFYLRAGFYSYTVPAKGCSRISGICILQLNAIPEQLLSFPFSCASTVLWLSCIFSFPYN